MNGNHRHYPRQGGIVKAEGWVETKPEFEWKLKLSDLIVAEIYFNPTAPIGNLYQVAICYEPEFRASYPSLNQAQTASVIFLAQELSTATQSLENMKGKG